MEIVNNVVYGGPATYIPSHLSFAQYVFEKLKYSEDGPALINGQTGEQISRKQLLQHAVDLATGLRKMGVKRGDVVGICSEARFEYFISTIGAMCCGATVTTANPMYVDAELKHVLDISKPKLIFCSKFALEKNFKTLKTLNYIENIIQFDESAPLDPSVLLLRKLQVNANVMEFQVTEVDGEDPVLILYSSGTTGLPKGVVLTHVNTLFAAVTANEYGAGSSIFLSIVPWYHGYGLIINMSNMVLQRTIVYLPVFQPETYLKTIQTYKIEVLLAVPPVVLFLAKSPLVNKYDVTSITTIWCAAAPLSQEVILETLRRLPNCKAIRQAYGMTETCLACTLDLESNKTVKPGSGGTTVPGVRLKIVHCETGIKLGPYGKGEVCVKGPNLMKGYANNATATKEIFDEEGYLKTGDIGYYDEDGYIFIVDRLKEIIKYKGYQVPPAEVEGVLLQHESVAECGVVGTPDNQAGELPTAFIVLKPGAKVTEKQLIDFAASKLSHPKRLHGGIIFTDNIPKNPSGKILRRLLKERITERNRSKL